VTVSDSNLVGNIPAASSPDLPVKRLLSVKEVEPQTNHMSSRAALTSLPSHSQQHGHPPFVTNRNTFESHSQPLPTTAGGHTTVPHVQSLSAVSPLANMKTPCVTGNDVDVHSSLNLDLLANKIVASVSPENDVVAIETEADNKPAIGKQADNTPAVGKQAGDRPMDPLKPELNPKPAIVMRKPIDFGPSGQRGTLMPPIDGPIAKPRLLDKADSMKHVVTPESSLQVVPSGDGREPSDMPVVESSPPKKDASPVQGSVAVPAARAIADAPAAPPVPMRKKVAISSVFLQQSSPHSTLDNSLTRSASNGRPVLKPVAPPPNRNVKQ